MEFDLYKDIKSRTFGEIYIGVVGPVRTGKSTFIKKFMEQFVIPEIEDPNDRARTMDELPQSGTGTLVMTTEPKFIPQEAKTIQVSEDCSFKVRLVDCVGYMVKGASGHMEGDTSRMVHTPWFKEEIPFQQAAEYGTTRVIKEHATIGVVVTTDGSFSNIPRENYQEAEKKAIHEMESQKKPFVIVLNCENPKSANSVELAERMKEEYHYPVLPLNCTLIEKDDILELLHIILTEFPVTQINYYVPKWTFMLDMKHPVREHLIQLAKTLQTRFLKMRQVYQWKDECQTEEDSICATSLKEIHAESGVVDVQMEVKENCYYDYISEMADMEIHSECELIERIRQLSSMEQEYDRLKNALESVEERGYGIVLPELKDFEVEEPELINHGNKYGVKMHAVAPSIHMIQTNIETEIAPIVGSREQAEDLVAYINNAKHEETGLWNANIFGKSVGELFEEGMKQKLYTLDDECQRNIKDSMQKIANDNNGGMICIII